MSEFTYNRASDTSNMYRFSAIPFLSSSIQVPISASAGGNEAIKIEFPRVTKFITIRNSTGRDATNGAGQGVTGNPSIRVGFSKNALEIPSGSATAPNNYIILDAGESYTADWRVTELWLFGNNGNEANGPLSADIIAGTTPVHTGSVYYNNWSGSAGVG